MPVPEGPFTPAFVRFPTLAATMPRSRRARPGRAALLAGLLGVGALLVAACSSTGSDDSASTTEPPTSTPTTAAPTTSTTQPPGKDAVVFVTVGGNIDVYSTQPPFDRQRVVAAGTAPDGSEAHGQVCFLPDGSRRFVVAETRPAQAGKPAGAGFGLYQLTGDDVGTYRVARIGGVADPAASAGGGTTTYGCAFLPDGRLFTTVVGAASGAPTGQLTEWFPPFTAAGATHCTIATGLATPGGLAADRSGGIEVAVSRAPGAGVWRFSGSFPTSATACGALSPPTTTASDHGGGPTTVASGLSAVLLVAAGPHGLSAPAAVAASADGKGIVVSSPPDGVIDSYDLSGRFVSTVLAPKAGEQLGATPRTWGTPFGVAVNADGAVFYADPGLLKSANGTIAPGTLVGSLRRIVVTGGKAAPPQLVNGHLPQPDGLGIFDPSAAAGGSASIA